MSESRKKTEKSADSKAGSLNPALSLYPDAAESACRRLQNRPEYCSMERGAGRIEGKREGRISGMTEREGRIYYEDDKIRIRDMKQSDAGILTREEIAQGWDSHIEKLEMRLCHQAEGKAAALVAEYEGKPAGYIHVYPDSRWGAFAGLGYPEIVDFAVLEKYRGRGIGNRLMDAAEEIAAEYADMVYLGVGLHSGYGSAQRLYVRRGYMPDGSGVWYGESVCEPYADCRNDDDLNLYFSKKLR